MTQIFFFLLASMWGHAAISETINLSCTVSKNVAFTVLSTGETVTHYDEPDTSEATLIINENYFETDISSFLAGIKCTEKPKITIGNNEIAISCMGTENSSVGTWPGMFKTIKVSRLNGVFTAGLSEYRDNGDQWHHHTEGKCKKAKKLF